MVHDSLPPYSEFPRQPDPTLWDWLQRADKDVPQPAAPKSDSSFSTKSWTPLLLFALLVMTHLALRNLAIPRPLGYFIYLACLGGLAYFTWNSLVHEASEATEPIETWFPEVRLPLFGAALVMIVIAFLWLPNNQFTAMGALAWLGSVACFVAAVWQVGEQQETPQFSNQSLGRWLLLAGLLLGGFLRFWQLDQVPVEMTSDHIEKLVDIQTLLSGSRPIFMPMNGGRESLQFYLAWLAIAGFGAPIAHITLKVIMATVGYLTLPILYLMTREATEDEGLAGGAVLLCALAWWPNVISRNGLRFPLAPFFAALTAYFLIKAIKRDSFNALVLAGVCCGFGLYGYTAIRIMPVIMVAGVVLAWFHLREKLRVANIAYVSTLMAGFVMLLLFVPMLRYSFDDPVGFWHRTLTRMTESEAGYETAAVMTLLGNIGRALTMFLDQHDLAWFTTPAGQPALDWLTGSLLYFGWTVSLMRWIKTRDWIAGFLTVSLPLALLPSILALAFPSENPSVTRAGVALPFVFVIVAIGAKQAWQFLREALTGHKGLLIARLVFGIGIAFIGVRNYNIVFNNYASQYASTAPNTREMAGHIAGYIDFDGTWETTWVIAYPHWIDTRAIGYQAGNPDWHNVILPDTIMANLVEISRVESETKFFIHAVADTGALDILTQLFPDGFSDRIPSKLGPDRDFMIYYVP